ncbi:MAG: zf-TFIIB domain-containing protein [Candidatus Omnitrophota bacterium]
MDCPKCLGKLKKKTIENTEVDSCFVCEGIWFDAGELESILRKDSKDFKFDQLGRDEFDGKELEELKGLLADIDQAVGNCPCCAEVMTKVVYKGEKNITVDICLKGHGIWLDGGEVRLLRERSLVKIYDFLVSFKDFLRYIFSKEGLADLMKIKNEQVKKKQEGLEPK